MQLIASEKDPRWQFNYQLLAVYGLRPEELRFLVIKDGVRSKELWTTYEKSMGGVKGQKTEPRKLAPLYVKDGQGCIDWNLLERVEKKEELPKETLIENLKIKVRKLSDQDIKTRNLPNQTSGLVITSIEKNSPLTGSIEVNSIILEAQKKKIRNVEDLNQVLKQVLNSNQKTILLVIYNSQNQKRYIGVKLD